jgi:hypothetical protein
MAGSELLFEKIDMPSPLDLNFPKNAIVYQQNSLGRPM